MNHETSFARMTVDTSPAAALVHVSPIFFRSAPCTRGVYAESRLARTRRTDARHARNVAAFLAATGMTATTVGASSAGYVDEPRNEGASLDSAAAPTSLTRYSDAIPGNTSNLHRRTDRQ